LSISWIIKLLIDCSWSFVWHHLEPNIFPYGPPTLSIALLHDDVTINTFIKIILLNARDHGRLEGTKRKFTENRSETSINSRREAE